MALSPIAGEVGSIYAVLVMDTASNPPLYAYRKAHRVTRASLASQIGCATRTLARWEKGVSRPRMALAIHTSRVTELSLDELFGGSTSQIGRIDDPPVPV